MAKRFTGGSAGDAEDKSSAHIVSYDGGNGKFAAQGMVDGKLKRYSAPHVRAKVMGHRMNKDDSPFYAYDFAQFAGETWAYGNHILMNTELAVSTHQNSTFRYGDVAHIFWLLLSLAEMNYDSGSRIRLVVCVPPGLYDEVRGRVKDAFMAGMDGEGGWEIQLSREKKPRAYKIVSVLVITEGFGAYAGYAYDLEGNALDTHWVNAKGRVYNPLAGTVVIGDGGTSTFDQYLLVDGVISRESLPGSTDSDGGILHHLLTPALRTVQESIGKEGGLTTAHADFWMRNYMGGRAQMWGMPGGRAYTENASTIYVAGRALVLKDVWESLFQQYARWILENKIDPVARKAINAYVPVGGAWGVVFGLISEWRSDILMISPQSFTHTRNRAFWELNVVGGLSYATAKAKAQG